jgi:hypothetical protein
MMEKPMSDQRDDQVRRSGALDERAVLGAAPRAGGSTAVSGGAYDTRAGGDLGGPGARDPGDSAFRLSPENSREALSGDGMDERDGAPLAHEVFGSDEDTNPDQLSRALRHEDEG